LLNVVRDVYQTFQVVALGSPAAKAPASPPLLDREPVKEHAAAYVCSTFACEAPVTKPEKLQVQLTQR
jgi:uncharacterized protein YyaL (SSP411 family)